MASPTFGAAGTYLGGSARTSAAVPVPSGVDADAVVLIYLYIEPAAGSYAAITWPAGFTEKGYAEYPPGSGEHRLYVAWKRATGADSGTYSVTWGGASRFVEAVAVRYSGCVTTGDPFDQFATENNASASTTAPAASVTTTVDDTLLVYAGSDAAGSGSWTPASGMTERVDGGGFRAVTVDDLAQATAGASGSKSAVATNSSGMCSVLGALMSVLPGQSVGPASDVTTTGWTATGGTGTLASAMDEDPLDDADYVTSPADPSASVLEVALGTLTDPVSSTGHQLAYRVRVRDAGTYTVVAALYQGATLIASETRSTGLTSTFQTFSLTLSGAEADAITDYTDLRFRATVTAAP